MINDLVRRSLRASRCFFTQTGIVSLALGAMTLTACNSRLPASPSAPDPTAVPSAIEGGVPFATLSATGSARTCGLTATGAAYCWGSGQSTEGDFLLGGNTFISDVPVAVSSPLHFVALSVGYIHSCGVTTAGSAYCWGSNVAGEAGIGSTDTLSAPRVPVAGAITFAAVTAGGWHSCGLSSNGMAYCWGMNHRGQLGAGADSGPQTCNWPRGSASCGLAPVAVTGGLTFTTISAGDYHACALTAGGSAYCWGDNVWGQLGNNSTVDSSNVPVLVGGGLTFVAIQAGGDHACALTGGGTAYCWGANRSGELGIGSTVVDRMAAPTMVSGGLEFGSISAGDFHTCAVTTAGAAYCWGDNEASQLGTGAGSRSTRVPVPVVGSYQFAAIAAGFLHTCALTAAGLAYCWGDELCTYHTCW